MILAFFLFCWFLACFPIGLFFDSLEPAVQVLYYGKLAKKEANVISYFLMTNVSEWHPCLSLPALQSRSQFCPDVCVSESKGC